MARAQVIGGEYEIGSRQKYAMARAQVIGEFAMKLQVAATGHGQGRGGNAVIAELSSADQADGRMTVDSAGHIAKFGSRAAGSW